MGGLKEEIRMELQVLELTSRYKGISMARNIERKLVQAGTLKDSVLNKKSNFQSIYLGERFHYNNGKCSSNLVLKVTLSQNWDGKNEKIREVRRGIMRGV